MFRRLVPPIGLVALMYLMSMLPALPEDLYNDEGILGGSDERLTWPEFAAAEGISAEAVHRAFSAVGTVNCQGYEGTGWVAGKPDVVVTAGHIFTGESCETNRGVEGCIFIPLDEQGSRLEGQAVRAKPGTLRIGDCKRDPKQRFFDWAVFKLEAPLADVRPFALPAKLPGLTSLRDEPVIALGAQAHNFEGPQTPSAVRCKITHIWPKKHAPAGVDCDTGHGTSGGPYLYLRNIRDLWKDNLEVIGISVSRLQYGDGDPMLHLGNYNTMVPFPGNEPFYKAVMETVASSDQN